MEDKIKRAEDWYNKNKDIYSRFSYEVAQIIEKILKSKNIPYHSVAHRVKEKDSYLNKCKKDKYLNPIEDIMDVSGIRIISYTKNDAEKICGIIEQEFIIDSNNSVNKIDELEENRVGYLSTHYIAKLNDSRANLAENSIYENCKCEIQVRTLLQHAWAEIEHDRSYKFYGVLPKEIKRRFYLIAGVLEMMDGEFDTLSKEFDKYSKKVQTKTRESDFDIEINTESLSQYLLSKFKNNDYFYYSKNIVNKSITEELISFGFKKVQDIDRELTEEKLSKLLPHSHKTTFIGFLRDLMMLLDAEKYFSVSYNGAWKGVEIKDVKRWEGYGVKNIEQYLKDSGIFILMD